MSDRSPYDVTDDMIRPDLEGVDDDVVRSRYIVDEVRVVAVGWFYYCLAAFQLSLMLGICFLVEWEEGKRMEIVVAVLSVSSVLFAVIGYGMRHFLEWARVPSLVAAVVGMFMFPFGTLAGIYCLLLLRKSTVVEIFSERYRKMVEAENYKSLGWLAVVTGVLLGGVFWGGYYFLQSVVVK